MSCMVVAFTGQVTVSEELGWHDGQLRNPVADRFMRQADQPQRHKSPRVAIEPVPRDMPVPRVSVLAWGSPCTDM